MRGIKLAMKYLLGVFFVAAGLNHFISTVFYMNIMPPYLPWHLLLVYVSGGFEIGFGVFVLIPRFSVVSAWGLIVLLIAVFPANIHMAVHPWLYPNISPLALWLRLPLQAIFIVWAFWFTRADRWSRVR
ncbi:MAG TPA: DoxX family protein [Blastocatellia bacterium]|nr:DoxX family protein [Blastocatellia bacterium]